MRFQVVSFHCVLKNKFGRVISTSFNQDVSTQAPEGEVTYLPGFAKALKLLKAGERKKIFLTADQAYGLYDPKLQVEASRSQLQNGKNLKLGDEISGSVNGLPTIHTFRVISVNSRKVVLDGNHPLAGQDLIFDVEVTESREVEEHAEPPVLVSANDAWMH